MCARYELSDYLNDSKMVPLFEIMEREYPGQYKTGEIFPGDAAPAIISSVGRPGQTSRGDARLVPVPAVFGFPGFKGRELIVNARSETAEEKKTFSEGFRERRAVLPASGFYEWSRDRDKIKYLFETGSARIFYMCGIYGIFDGIYRFVILTRAAEGAVSGIHERMPVIIGESDVRPYITDLSAAQKLITASAPVLTRSRAE